MFFWVMLETKGAFCRTLGTFLCQKLHLIFKFLRSRFCLHKESLGTLVIFNRNCGENDLFVQVSAVLWLARNLAWMLMCLLNSE